MSITADDFVTRDQWGAAAPRGTGVYIHTPTPKLVLHHSAGAHSGANGVRSIQRFHMAPKPGGQGWQDVAYHKIVDPHFLDIYDGRRPGIRGAATFGHNATSHAICVMGNFDNEEPSIALLERLGDLVRFGHGEGWWPDRITHGHRDLRTTSCPGRKLYLQIDTINQLAKGTPAMDPAREFQTYLNSFKLGPPIKVDGDIGPKTRRRATEIETRYHVLDKLNGPGSADALVGRKFRELINEVA